MKDELFRRGQNNIEDAIFLRERVIPLAQAEQRWNVVVFESYRVLELLLKGMICLSGHTPKKTHKIESLVNRFVRMVEKYRCDLPVVCRSMDGSGNGYAVEFRDNAVKLWERHHSIYYLLGSLPGGWTTERLLQVTLSVNAERIEVSVAGRPVLKTFGRLVRPELRFRREFNMKPDSVRLAQLREAGRQLRATRESAFYSEKAYSEADARAAIARMDLAREASRVFVATPDQGPPPDQ